VLAIKINTKVNECSGDRNVVLEVC